MKIAYFAPVEWDSIRQRPHHIAERLCARHDFLYIQPLGLRSMRLSDLSRVSRRLASVSGRIRPSANLKIRTFFSIPIVHPFIEKVNMRLIEKQMRTLVDNDTVVWITAPSSVLPGILGRLQFKTLVYEMMDDYAQFHPALEKDILASEALIAGRADLIIVTSAALAEKARRLSAGKEPVIVGNGVDYDLFGRCDFDRPRDLDGMRRIAGYVGSVDSWMDMETIAFLADRREDVDFVFIGPVKTRKIPVRSNIHFMGPRDYHMIPDYCNSFDVCLIPFRTGEFADTINPVKLYEYFALGKPVVANRMKELLPFDALLYLAEGGHDFLDKLGRALAEEDTGIGIGRKRIAEMNDWSQKAALVEEALRGASV
jgi:glycosyltransferase involved in cell wall biosynthesis